MNTRYARQLAAAAAVYDHQSEDAPAPRMAAPVAPVNARAYDDARNLEFGGVQSRERTFVPSDYHDGDPF